ncbi:hypothetical protein DIPPA_07328 [Diplonema papillatum]|nr:hypothetical protein DIPPA_07328 [Diplonema papillatum]
MAVSMARVVLLAAWLVSRSHATPTITGGPNHDSVDPNDWFDMYPGCGLALEKAQQFTDSNANFPRCAFEFDTCLHEATGERNMRNRMLCSCLGDYKVCVQTLIPAMLLENGTAVAPQGCPDILFSRMCTEKQQTVIEQLSFGDANAWECTTCDVEEESDQCAQSLSQSHCSCYFSCPPSYELSCDGYQCHSVACLVSLMRCWVHENGCSTLTAWNICLHDAAVVHNVEGEYVTTERHLRCRLSMCRDAITHIEHSDAAAYMWILGYCGVFAFCATALLLSHHFGRRHVKSLMREYKLQSPKKKRW